LPAVVRGSLVAWRTRVTAGALAGDVALRPVVEDALHVTLCFLGAAPVESVPALSRIIHATAAPTPELVLGTPLWLPRRRPNVLAVALEDHAGALQSLQARLAGPLVDGGWYRREVRPYLPHVTVARVRGGRRASHVVPLRPPRLPAPPPVAFSGGAVLLQRSYLGPGGSRYETLVRADPSA